MASELILKFRAFIMEVLFSWIFRPFFRSYIIIGIESFCHSAEMGRIAEQFFWQVCHNVVLWPAGGYELMAVQQSIDVSLLPGMAHAQLERKVYEQIRPSMANIMRTFGSGMKVVDCRRWIRGNFSNSWVCPRASRTRITADSIIHSRTHDTWTLRPTFSN